MALIVEILDGRTGEVRLRRRVDGTPLTFGRGYDNDVVLDDPYADARHARLAPDESGVYVLDDLGSVNALVTGRGRRERRVVARAGLVVRLGRTRVRFQDPDAPLPAALPDGPVAAPVGWQLRWPMTTPGRAGLVTLATLAIGWTTWLGSYAKNSASTAVGMSLGFLVIAAPWAGVWAVASRMVVHRFRYLAHLAVVAGIGLAGTAYGVLAGWGSFAFPAFPLATALGVAVVLALVVALVAGHLQFASTLPAPRRWGAGLIVAATILVVGAIVRLADNDSFSDVPTFAATLRPLPPALLPSGTVAGFHAVAEDLKRQVDELAEEDQ